MYIYIDDGNSFGAFISVFSEKVHSVLSQIIVFKNLLLIFLK